MGRRLSKNSDSLGRRKKCSSKVNRRRKSKAHPITGVAKSNEVLRKKMDTQDWLNHASQIDLRLAAEAVVDSALHSHETRLGLKVSDETREDLIAAVFDDPLVTPELFDAQLFCGLRVR